MDVRVSMEEQLRAQRLDQVREIQHRHRGVLSCYPSAHLQLPDPHDDHPCRHTWQRQVHRARTLLLSLEAPDPARLRDDARRLYTEILEDERYLIDDLPETIWFENDPGAWINTFLDKLRVIDAVAKIKDINKPVATGGHATQAVASHRQTALRLLTARHAATFETHPTFHRLLPSAHDETISKRVWEHQLYMVRSLLRLVQQGDRTASHYFILGHYEDVLRRHPALRNALPDPTEENVTFPEWANVFLTAVHSMMRSD